MGDFLARLPRFALEAEETFDEVPDGQLRRQLTNVRRIAMERPNHFAADVTGDTLNRASWYDGRAVTVLDKDLPRVIVRSVFVGSPLGCPGLRIVYAADS
jgi:hypothetical protein